MVCGEYDMTRGQNQLKISPSLINPPNYTLLREKRTKVSISAIREKEKKLKLYISTPLLIKREPNFFPSVINYSSIPKILCQHPIKRLR